MNCKKGVETRQQRRRNGITNHSMEITKATATATSTLAAAIHNLSLSSLSSTIRPRPRPYSHSGFSKFPLVSRPTSLTATCSLPNETTTSSEWLNYVLFRVLWTGFWLFLLFVVVFCLCQIILIELGFCVQPQRLLVLTLLFKWRWIFLYFLSTLLSILCLR